MTTQETIAELEQVRDRLKRIRLGNRRAVWFCELLKAIEILLVAAKKAVEHVTKSIS